MQNRFTMCLLSAVAALTIALPCTGADGFLADRQAAQGLTCNACHKETPPAKRVKTEQCQTCHGDYAALAKRTAAMKPNNVHENHLGDLDCRECHQGHKSDKLACAECHQFTFSMPK